MKRKLTIYGSITMIATLFAVAVYAAVTFNPPPGDCTGFVGKGDVQTPFGWNNAALQTNASGVTFKYVATASYEVTIEFDTGNPAQPKSINHHVVTQTKETAVNATVARTLRKNPQDDVTGFNLTGCGATTISGDPIPSVGDGCPNGNLGTCQVTAVTPIGSTGGLQACYNNVCHPIQ